MKSTFEEKQAEIELHMLNLVYQYTRKPDEIEDALNKTIDYSGKNYLEQQASKKDFFENGAINAHELKISKMKRKLNQSVDFANIKHARLERKKVKYQELDGYKNISEAMTYRADIYDANLDIGLDLKNSPMQPAQVAKEIFQQQKKKVTLDTSITGDDVYSTKLPIIEQFVGAPAM